MTKFLRAVCLASIWFSFGPPALAEDPANGPTTPLAGSVVPVGPGGASYATTFPGGGGAGSPSALATNPSTGQLLDSQGDVFGTPWGFQRVTASITQTSVVPTNKWWSSLYWGVNSVNFPASSVAPIPPQYPVANPLQFRFDHVGPAAPAAGAYDGVGIYYNYNPLTPALQSPLVLPATGGLSYKYDVGTDVRVNLSYITATTGISAGPLDNISTTNDIKLDSFSLGTVTLDIRNGTLKATMGRQLPFAYFSKGGDQTNWRIQVTRYWGGPGTFDPANPSVVTDPSAPGAAMLCLNKNRWGIYGLPGTIWTFSQDSGLALLGSGAGNYLAIALLPDGLSDVAAHTVFVDWAKRAYAVPVGSDVSWSYDEAGSAVTTWFTTTTTIQPGAPAGALNETVLALYRHQTDHLSSAPNSSLAFSHTPRGEMRVQTGNSFSTRVPFAGLPPFLPEAYSSADRDTLAALLTTALAGDPWRGTRPADNGTGYTLTPANYQQHANGDTYGLGQGLQMVAQLAVIADKLGDSSARDRLTGELYDVFATYFRAAIPPGSGTVKANRYFAYDAQWGTMLGYPSSFGASTILNDHHFHYGYWITAAAILARYRPDFVADYGPMVELLIKDVANWDRTDRRFPVLRYFDPYESHSWASGPQLGQNQESISEAVNFATGVALWGLATDNRAVRDLGVYLWTHETLGGWYYWFNVDGGEPTHGYLANSTPASIDFNRVISQVGQVNDNGSNYGTFFGYNPSYIMGITRLPFNGGATWLGRYPAAQQRLVDFWNAEVATSAVNPPAPAGSGPYNCLGAVTKPAPSPCRVWWADLRWMSTAMVDAAAALADYGALQTDYYSPSFDPVNWPAYRTPGESQTHTDDWLRTFGRLGPLTTTVTADTMSYAVFSTDPTGQGALSCFADNPGATTITTTFSSGARLVLAPRSFGSVACAAAPGSPGAVAVMPVSMVLAPPAATGSITVTARFPSLASPATLTLSGPAPNVVKIQRSSFAPLGGGPSSAVRLPAVYAIESTGLPLRGNSACLPVDPSELASAGLSFDSLRFYTRSTSSGWAITTTSRDAASLTVCGTLPSSGEPIWIVLGGPSRLLIPFAANNG
ncbi:MAG: glycosyl hydrolase [Dehalococcoidia bacterium]